MKASFNFGRLLTRSEMKNLIGGSAFIKAQCQFSGCAPSVTISYSIDNTNAANFAQQESDAFCCDHDCCETVNCPGATASISSCN
jgi:hypothetical protein